MRLRTALTLAILLTAVSPARPIVAGDGRSDSDKPVFVSANSNTVAYYNELGQMRSTTQVPGTSVLGHHSSLTCTFTADRNDTTSDGQSYVIGQQVTSSRFVYVEFESMPTTEAPGPTGPISKVLGPLSGAKRLFGQYCDSIYEFRSTIWVGVNDPFLDPRPTARNLLNNLQLIRPAIYTNPVVDKWGGLVTRYPAWLAILPDAWQEQRSNVAYHRGWTIYLHTAPRTMEFDVNFVPNPDKPSPAFHGIIPCVPAVTGGDSASFPAMPALPAQTEPGVNGACMWTPPGPGHVTIQARITYTVTLWVNGYTEAMPDYTWTSPATTYETGELSAVNINN